MDWKRGGRMAAALALAGALGLPAGLTAETKVRLPAGKKIHFTLNQYLGTDRSREGDNWSGVVSRNVRVGDQIVIPEGSTIHGTVTGVTRAGRVKGRAMLDLSYDEIELPNGTKLEVTASLTEVDEAEKEEVTEEGTIKGEGSKKRDAAEIGGGAGIGTAIGAIAGGGKGAAIGAGAGAAAATGLVLLQRGKDVKLPRGSELAIQLDRPLTVPVD